MTLTSFKPVRRKLGAKHWRTLHKGGIYFLWATVWSTYWYELDYYDDIQLIDYVFYWAGFLAWGTRMLAWSKRRRQPAMSRPRFHPPVDPARPVA
jgi:DMSO/TMAO reductase YedYZ heme-binding membrane subunit